MKYHVLLGDVHHEVEVTRHAGGLAVTLDGETHQVDAATITEGTAYHLLVDGRSLDVGVEETDNTVALLIGGRRYGAEVLGEREWLARSIQVADTEGERTVRAVMTGIVREVNVEPGQAVAAGQLLFILEAMKMENEVKAEVEGTVKAVHVQSGSTVNLGDVVVEID